MDFEYPAEAEVMRTAARTWLTEHLTDEFRALGTGTEFQAHDWPVRRAWERELGAGGWIGLSWSQDHGGRGVSLMEELVFAEEYATSGAPTRAGTFGEGMLGPTLIHFGSAAQQERFLPEILLGEQIWCQGFSEPSAGSDLAALSTKARLDGDRWVLDGQKVWTSQANLSDWIFLLARTDATVAKHKGVSFFLLPLDQPGIDVRPLRDAVGGEHFCEVFLDGAVTDADLIVGEPGDGWSLAMATLSFERGTAFMAQLKRYGSEFDRLVRIASERGALHDPLLRDEFARLHIGLQLMRFGGYRTISSVMLRGQPGPEASIGKLQWSQWHQDVGVLAMRVLGSEGQVLAELGDELREIQHAFLFSRAHTIYAGSSQVQRNIIGERVLGLPKEPG